MINVLRFGKESTIDLVGEGKFSRLFPFEQFSDESISFFASGILEINFILILILTYSCFLINKFKLN